MKKKVRELTEEESQKICMKYSGCHDCPFCVWPYENDSPICIEGYLDKEVEVPE